MKGLTDMPISFPGLFGDWEFNPDPIAIHIGHGIYWYGIILAIGRIVGESAILMFTAGMSMFMQNYGSSVTEFFKNLFDSSGATLTVALYVYAKERAEFDVAFAIAAILMILTLLINLAAGIVGRQIQKRSQA